MPIDGPACDRAGPERESKARGVSSSRALAPIGVGSASTFAFARRDALRIASHRGRSVSFDPGYTSGGTACPSEMTMSSFDQS